ncbi:unnamed protein product [Urochloa decumbens]|uniref:Major facilitator superfamily (MFS) profile domain-containing protein n=1 Tax=Urochloa decumbens TaxID=240449 RepID=A0ABC9FNE6_9POAL
MAGEGFVAAEAGARDYGSRVTFSVVVTCLMAASCGLIFGYDSGVSGGVTQMQSFLSDFFPDVLSGMKNTKRGVYCKYDNQGLTAFTSSLFIASALSSIVASYVTRRVGRQAIMLFGGAMFFAGAAIINGGAVNIAMLVIGRMLLGFAFGVFVILGAIFATVTNYFTNDIPGWGWRVSLGLAGAPGTLLVVGTFFVSDTPSSLVLRGRPDQARAALLRIRGADADVEAELKDIVRAVEEANRNDEGAFRRLFSRQYLLVGVAIPVLYELTGINVINIFMPVVFRTVGFSSKKAILGSVINFLVNLVATLLSGSIMDHTGRRILLIVGGLCVTICQVAISCIMAVHLGTEGMTTMPRSYAMAVLVLMMVSTFCMGVSWGPLRWVVQSEIYPVEVRSAGQAMGVSIWLCLTFMELQVFIRMLCAMRYGVFLFHAGWFLVGTICMAAFLPETKGVPLERMRTVWAQHWYWRRFADVDDKQSKAAK